MTRISLFKPSMEAEGELLEGLQALWTCPVYAQISIGGVGPLPPQLRWPAVEELPHSSLTVVIPQLPRGSFEQIGSIEAPIRCQQERGAFEVLWVREQSILLSLREKFL
jgi:hypothetical protein